ncbi:MAG: thiamine diphosphokinase [Deltaproteobacteria bacterium]
MRTIIISNGTIEDYDAVTEIIKPDDYIICADGGALHARKLGIVPNVLIGDGDSIDQETLKYYESKGVTILSYPKEKDQTDTQLAVEYAYQQGSKEMVLFGCIGTRFDHTFGNVAMLIWLMKRGVRGVIVNKHNEVHVIDRYIVLEGKPGDRLSLLPITPKINGIFTTGLKYALQDGELVYDQPMGISNEFIANEAQVVIRDGMLMVVKSRD